MPTTANTINYFAAADGTLRDGPQGSISQTPRIYYGTEYSVTLTFPASTIAEGDQLQVALNRSRTFFSSASATGDAPVAAVAKHDVTAEEAAAQAVTLTLSTNTRAMIDQVNGIDHPVRGFFGVHVLRGQSFVTLAVADALMMSLESGPDAISPSLPVVDYPTREEAEALAERSENAAERAEEAAAGIVPPLQLSSPPTTSTTGSVGQLAVWHDGDNNKDHLYHLCFVSEGESATLYHWEECVLVSQGNVAGGYPVLDENGHISSSSIPIMSTSVIGGAALFAQGGILLTSGRLYIYSASNAHIDARVAGVDNSMSTNARSPIVPACLDYAVRSVLPNVTEIPAATSDYSLVDSSATTNNHSHVYSHTPTTAPTYRLPQVTDTTIAHYIELTVDFANVQTYSFLDYQGEPIVPLFTPSIAAGDVYTFKCEYSAVKAAWLIYPQKQGAVADDFVMCGEVGAANGVAGLDANVKVPTSQLPVAGSVQVGVVAASGSNGISVDAYGNIYISTATTTLIDGRSSSRRPISPTNLNYAVTAALTDANHISLTDAQKATAQSVFGVGGPVVTIPAATSAYTLAEGIFTHAPTNAPTYTLPNITDDIRTHEVVLIIDFSSVQTFLFLVDGGGDVTFQSYANPTMGDVWAFRCWWYGGKWRIAPMKIKNCVTRQLANGSLAITDAVAGDALALKMAAPRSVVVNQQIDWSNGSITSVLNSTYATIQLDRTNKNAVLTIQSPSTNNGVIFAANIVSGHKYIVHGECISSVNASSFMVGNTAYFQTPPSMSLSAGIVTEFTMSAKVIGNSNNLHFYLDKSNAAEAGSTLSLTNVQLVDLTQYFNGDQTLIDSIQTWDDLVAYDPRFAQYVEYNTGTVTGVQPSVQVTGKNLFDKTADGISSGYLAVNGSVTASNKFSCTDYIPVRQQSIITCSYPSGSESTPSICFYRADKTFISGIAHGGDFTSKTYTCPVGCAYIRDSFKSVDSDTYQIELGSSATAYEPYHDGGTAQAPVPLFAVGNAADEFEAVSGTTTRKMSSVDMGTLAWTYNSGLSGFYAVLPANAKVAVSGQGISIICQAYPHGTSGTNKTCNAVSGWISGKTILIIRDSSYEQNAASLKTDITGKTLYYELATTTTSQSTPTQISLQAGSNIAMQTDGGRLAPIDITYESDEL